MTRPTTQKLADALMGAGAPMWMVRLAQSGYYDDFKSPLPAPQLQLRKDAIRLNLKTIIEAQDKGEFDATKEEADAWMQSVYEDDPELREAIDLMYRAGLLIREDANDSA